MQRYDFDLVVIGAGSGGVRASRFAGLNHGKRVAIIENRRTGGTCVMRGCVPKKLLVYGAHFAEEFQDARGYGWSLKNPHLDWKQLISAKNDELDRLENIYHKLLAESGVKEFWGTGRIIDPHTVEVNGTRITSKNILIATGGKPSLPKIPGIEAAITSDEALDLNQLPKKIVIIGGGYIATEFAGIFNSLGVKVTIVMRANYALRGFDETIRKALTEEMQKKGIRVLRNCQLDKIIKSPDGYKVQLDSNECIEVDKIMCATGRTPNTANLGLEGAGVMVDKIGAIVVNKYSVTTVKNIFAIGDATNRVNLTPVALAEAMAIIKTVYGSKKTHVNYKNIPSAVFSSPPIGVVGLTENEAREQSDVNIFLSRFRPMKYILAGRDERSVMKIISDKKTDRVLGVHMLGLDAPEIIQGIAIAITAGVKKSQFDYTIGIHPTSAEEFVSMRSPLEQ